jgi:hypothetical protein
VATVIGDPTTALKAGIVLAISYPVYRMVRRAAPAD